MDLLTVMTEIQVRARFPISLMFAVTYGDIALADKDIKGY
jgi:hypothetical protein